MDFASFATRHERAIIFLVAVLVVLGLASYTQTPASIFPEMKFSRIDVVADVGNLPPEQVRVAVTMPLEREFLGLPSAQSVRTTSALGSAEWVVEFDPKTDPQVDLQYVDQAISRERAQLPPGTNVDANVVQPQSEPIVSFALTSQTVSQTLLREYAQLNIIPALYGVPGLGRMLLVGGPTREYHVTLDPSALAAAGISAKDVGDAVAQANDVEAVGIAEHFSQRSALVVDAQLRTAAQLRDIVVPNAQGRGIPLSSLGSVELATAPVTQQFGYAGEHGVAMNFYALAGADQVSMGEGVKSRLAALARRLPSGIVLHQYWDANDLVVDSQRSLRDAILLGAALAVGVIFFFLRNLRITLVSAIVIPAALAIAIFALHTFGQTLNIMSVGGLAIAVGLIIDDAIVVVEGIARTLHDQPEMPIREVVEATVRKLVGPMTASTLATVVVFLPLTLLSGVSGAFFRSLALTLASALIVSLALAVGFTPVLARLALRTHTPHDEPSSITRALRRYDPILRWALNHRIAVYGLSALVLIVTVILLKILPSDFLPQLDEGQFEIAYVMPVGTTIAESDAAAAKMERIVKADPAVVAEGRFTGIDTNGFSPTPVRNGTIRVKLKPLNERASYDVISERLRDALGNAVPAAQLDIHQIIEDLINDLSGAPQPIQVAVTGPDQTVLNGLATKISDGMSKIPSITDAFSGVVQDDPTTRVSPSFAQLARSGIDTGSLVSALSAATQGTVATQLAEPTMLVPVRIGVTGAQGGTPADVPFHGADLPLSLLATTSVDRTSTDITELNGQREVIVTANLAGSLSSAIDGLNRELAGIAMPPGYRTEIGGAYRQQQDSFREFLSVIAIAVLFVFFVMLVAFRSYRLPVVVLAAVPLALIGVALALTITRTPFNVSSFMGLLLLVGIVVKNGILLIDAANRRSSQGERTTDALVGAAHERLRPILMTTFAAIGGLLPLAFGQGSGAAMERPLAIAVIGGLSTATAFTLILIPVLYGALAPRHEVHSA